VVYTAETRALACLETTFHLNAAGLPFNRYLVEMTIPDEVWGNAQVATTNGLPVGWDAEPAGQVSIHLVRPGCVREVRHCFWFPR
jgi:hypothetical protein